MMNLQTDQSVPEPEAKDKKTMAADLRADRHSNRLLNLERKIFLTEDVNGNEKEVACMIRSVHSPSVRAP